MTTQLRLVDSPKTAPKHRGRVAPKTSQTTAPKGATRARRPVHWGEWRLDDRTRTIGRAGVAAARRALEEARMAQELQRAS